MHQEHLYVKNNWSVYDYKIASIFCLEKVSSNEETEKHLACNQYLLVFTCTLIVRKSVSSKSRNKELKADQK